MAQRKNSPAVQLPVIKMPIRHTNPLWIREMDITGKICVNMESYYVTSLLNVEVLTVNFNSGTMRIRSPYGTVDCEAAEFFNQYKIVKA